MAFSDAFLSSSEAARRLGISIKALRLYEERGLIAPLRSEAGWRAYGPDQMKRAAQIVALRGLGLSLAHAGRLLKGEPAAMAPVLAAHQTVLEGQIRDLATTVERVSEMRRELARGQAPGLDDLTALLGQATVPAVAFDLPWPWGGERFELGAVRPLTYITGPLGSGKTRLARRLAELLPDAAFLGLDRAADGGAAARTALDADPALRARVEAALAWLVEDGGTASDALLILLAALEADGPPALVIDMLEQGLDKATQEALIARLRRRGPDARPLFLLTRSTAILDLDAVGSDEQILFCPANHGAPMRVAPFPGAPGYEALASCLASPEVRARTEGVVAWRPPAASP